jgi:hypothetical protein
VAQKNSIKSFRGKEVFLRISKTNFPASDFIYFLRLKTGTHAQTNIAQWKGLAQSISVTRLGEISPFGRILLLKNIAQMIGPHFFIKIGKKSPNLTLDCGYSLSKNTQCKHSYLVRLLFGRYLYKIGRFFHRNKICTHCSRFSTAPRLTWKHCLIMFVMLIWARCMYWCVIWY